MHKKGSLFSQWTHGVKNKPALVTLPVPLLGVLRTAWVCGLQRKAQPSLPAWKSPSEMASWHNTPSIRMNLCFPKNYTNTISNLVTKFEALTLTYFWNDGFVKVLKRFFFNSNNLKMSKLMFFESHHPGWVKTGYPFESWHALQSDTSVIERCSWERRSPVWT